MKTLLKSAITFTLMVALFMTSTITAFAERGENPYIQVIGYGTPVQGATLGLFHDTTTDMPAYCIDYNRSSPSPSSLTSELDPETIFDAATFNGMKSLLLHGYPFETGGLSNEDAQAATQLAVWCWTYETLGYGLDANWYSAIPGKENAYEYFIKLMEAARNQTPPQLSLSASDITMVRNGDVLIGETTVNFQNLQGGYTLDESLLPSGITVTGYNGNDGDTLTFTAPLSFAGQSFTVDNILEGHDTRSTMNLFWYDNMNPNQQRMAIPIMDTTSVAVSSGISFTSNGIGNVKLTKVDEKTNSPLAGAVFGVYDAVTDEKLAEIVTDENGEAVTELAFGEYYLLEITAPTGFTLSTEKYPLSLVRAEIAITATNSQSMGTVKIIKTGGDGEKLSGVVFDLYNKNTDEKIATLTTDENGVVSHELPLGDYYLTETVTNEGYNLLADNISFVLSENSETVTLAIKNKKIPAPEDGKITIVKKAYDTGEKLEGAVFGVYNNATNEKLTEITTGTDGTATFELPQGEYYLLEQTAPSGYQLNTEKFSFSVTSGEAKEIIITNTLIDIPKPEPGNVVIIKKSDSGNFLSGAVFGVYNADTDEKLAELTTNSSGVTSGTALEVGDYYLLELKAPTGYIQNIDKMFFTIKDGEAKEITVINLPENIATPTPADGSLLIIKKADGTGKLLENAVFGVYRSSDDEKVEDLTTDSYGEAKIELPVGDYYLRELKAPTGFVLNSDRIKVSIKSDTTKEITVTNKAEPTSKPTPTEKFGHLLIIKKADGTGEKLKDATFGVYRVSDDKKVDELITDRYGEAKIELPVGEYYLRELKAPSGFVINSDRIRVSIKSDTVKEITVTNKAEQTATPTPTEKSGHLLIIKKADGTGEKLKDATFGVYRVSDDKKVDELTTDRYGEAKIELPVGDYYLRELKAPTGYKLSTDRISFKIKSAETKEITVTNKAETPTVTPTPTPVEKTGSLQLIKSAEGTGKRLSGAIFGVYERATDKQLAEITSGTDGMATLKLPVGDYYLKELKAPADFKLETAKILFTVKESVTVKVEVTNMIEKTVQITTDNPPTGTITIPKTGEAFPTGSYAVALLCFSIAALCGVALYRGRKSRLRLA